MTQIDLPTALLNIIKDIPTIEEDGKNPHFRNSYATLENILKVVKPICFKHGMFFNWQHDIGEGEKPHLLLVFFKPDTKEKLIMARYGLEYAQNNPQAKGSAESYAKRYTLCSALCISTGDDDDGHKASPNYTREPYKPPQQPRPMVATPLPPMPKVTIPPGDPIYSGGIEAKRLLLGMLREVSMPEDKMMSFAKSMEGKRFSEIAKVLTQQGQK